MYGYSDQHIRESIKKHGRMTFAQFMETVLFSKNDGYYRSTHNVTDLDYYTSPTTHPAFGALISLQLEQLWEVTGKPTTFYVIEIGSGSGVLSNDILSYSRELNPKFQESLEYISVDYRHNSYLNEHLNLNTIKSNTMPFKKIAGCILSNELLDAFPVHRFFVDGDNIKEIYIQVNENWEIEEVLDSPSSGDLEKSLSKLGFDLPNGLRGEVNLKQINWIEEINSCLETGLVLTIDYGDTENNIYSAINSMGTLRCYYRHTFVSDPYIRLGMQDMTSLVNFTSLIRTGEFMGLKNAGFTTQRQFLSNLGFNAMLDNIRRSQLPQSTLDSNRMALLDLIKPTGMGNFKVLAQTKGLDPHLLLHGFNDNSPMVDTSLSGYRIPKTPLLGNENLKLMEQRYPHLSWDWDGMWPWGKD